MSDKIEVKSAPLIRSVRRGLDVPLLPVDQHEIIGRTRELEELTALFADDEQSRVAVLSGLGGIGKTKLAAAFAHQNASRFPDGIFFYREGESTQEVISETIRRLAPTARVPSDDSRALSLYKNLLAGKRVLTILDDVESEQTVRLLAPPAPSALLVTSRRNLVLPGVARIELGALPLAEAVQLLQTNLDPKRKIKADELAHLAETLQKFPLGLHVAIGHLNSNPEVSIRDWLSLVSAQDEPLPMKKFLELWLARISESSHGLREKIGMLAIFEGSFTLDALCSLWEVDERTARTNVNALASIVATQGDRLVMHSLVKHHFREIFGQEIGTSRLRHAIYFLNELRRIADRYREPSGRASALEAFEVSRADIEAGHAWAEYAALTSSDAGNLLIDYATVGFELFASQMPAEKWTARIKSALNECRKVDRPGERALLLYALGAALINQGNVTEALAYVTECIDVARTCNDLRMEGSALGALGLAHSRMGRMYEAIKCYENNLAIARSVSDRMAEANAIGNLGTAYASIGDISLATKHFEQQLTIARSLSDTLGEANAIGNLGLCRRTKNDLEGAQRLFEQQLALSTKLGDLRGEASALSNLGSIMLNRGNLIEAVAAFERSISIARHLSDRWQEGRLIGNLGNAYLAAGEIMAAIDAYAQQAEIARRNGDREGEGNALWNSAIAFEASGNIDAAIAQAKGALEIRRKLNDPTLAKTADWLLAHGVKNEVH